MPLTRAFVCASEYSPVYSCSRKVCRRADRQGRTTVLPEMVMLRMGLARASVCISAQAESPGQQELNAGMSALIHP